MSKYVFRRILYMLLSLFIVITITFFLMHMIPGDPLAGMARKLPEQIRENYYAKYGLDQPLIVQYAKFLEGLLHLDFGESLTSPGRSVMSIITTHAPVSGVLGIQAIAVGVILGIIFGIIAALKRNSWADYIVMFIAIVGVSVPSFVIASLLQYYFAVKFSILPTAGWGTYAHTILPTIALSFGSIATYARYMRASVLDVTNQDYILAARARGVSEFTLVWRHIIRNAILPAITILGPQVASIFTGSFVIETIFGIPGLGYNYVSSINNRDYSVILGLTVFFTTLYVLSLLIVDILYVVVDPRIRIADSKGR